MEHRKEHQKNIKVTEYFTVEVINLTDTVVSSYFADIFVTKIHIPILYFLEVRKCTALNENDWSFSSSFFLLNIHISHKTNNLLL